MCNAHMDQGEKNVHNQCNCCHTDFDICQPSLCSAIREVLSLGWNSLKLGIPQKLSMNYIETWQRGNKQILHFVTVILDRKADSYIVLSVLMSTVLIDFVIFSSLRTSS